MAAKRKRRRWSAAVTRHSDALDLERNVFKSKNPKRIAQSLKRSAARSHRRKAGPYQSAMSMLNFYTNRAGRNLPATQKKVLARAKDELRKLYGRDKPERQPATGKRKAGATRRGRARRGSRRRAPAAA